MKNWFHRILSLTAFSALACYPTAPDTNTTAAASTACETNCTNDMDACEIQCVMDMVDEYGFELCMNDCFENYDRCMYDDFAFRAPTYSICHLDVDVHCVAATTEIYTVDAYQNISCMSGPDKFKKRYLGKVTCSHWQLLEDFVNNGWDAQAIQNGACATRTANLMASLTAQGYFPGTANLDQDDCPHPRL